MNRSTAFSVSRVSLGVIIVLTFGVASTNADYVFGEPVNMGPQINSPGIDASPLVTPDGLQLYFSSDREGGVGEMDLWMSTRPTTDDEWSLAVSLGEPLNSPTWDIGPALSPDGLELYFCRGYGDEADLWVATRISIDDPWLEPTNLGPTVNDATMDCGPCVMPDGLTLYFYSDRLGEPPGGDLWMTTRPTLAETWGTPIHLESPVNTDTWDYWPHIAANGLALLFCSDREGGYGSEDVWMARRSSVSAAWDTPVNLGPPANTEAWDTCPYVSSDGRTYYFVSDRDGEGSYDLCQAEISPVVDLDDDGVVDCADINMIIEAWGTDSPLCDIGPTPFGDGAVDIQDLVVLIEHMVEVAADVDEVNDAQ